MCIPVFNGENYLRESIESVLAQTFEDFELVVCDNCSTDATPDIVRSFEDPRVGYVRNSNRCVEVARGEYVCIWHHDDVMLPENIERKVRVLDERPSVGFVHSDVELIDEAGAPLPRRWEAESRDDYVQPGIEVFRRYLSKMPMGGIIFIGTVLARRSCYQQLGPFRLELPNCHDNEMWMRMALYYDVACIGAPLVRWRWHSVSLSRTGGWVAQPAYLRQHYQAVRLVFREHQARIPRHREAEREACSAFANRAVYEAWQAFWRRDLRVASRYLALAARIAPRVITARAVRLLSGTYARRLYRRLRHRPR